MAQNRRRPRRFSQLVGARASSPAFNWLRRRRAGLVAPCSTTQSFRGLRKYFLSTVGRDSVEPWHPVRPEITARRSLALPSLGCGAQPTERRHSCRPACAAPAGRLWRRRALRADKNVGAPAPRRKILAAREDSYRLQCREAGRSEGKRRHPKGDHQSPT